jgi:hypothetical protein
LAILFTFTRVTIIKTNGTKYATAQPIILIPDIVIGKLPLSRLFRRDHLHFYRPVDALGGWARASLPVLSAVDEMAIARLHARRLRIAEGVWNILRSREALLEAIRSGCRLTKWNSTIPISFRIEKKP